ncbi:MAG TPA: hypothetical protein VGF56_06790 [Rhizomicrobium sp.]|jgi:hypothetical protein
MDIRLSIVKASRLDATDASIKVRNDGTEACPPGVVFGHARQEGEDAVEFVTFTSVLPLSPGAQTSLDTGTVICWDSMVLFAYVTQDLATFPLHVKITEKTWAGFNVTTDF